MAISVSRSTGPATSQSISATGLPCRETTFQGAASQWPMMSGGADFPAEPGPPAGASRRPERRRRVVQPPNQDPELVNGLVRPRRRVDHLTFDVREDFAALLVESVSDDARRSFEARLLQMAEQTMDRLRPGARPSDDHPAASSDCGSAAAGKRCRIGLIGHARTLAAGRPRDRPLFTQERSTS
jgi:hypothetical protein